MLFCNNPQIPGVVAKLTALPYSLCLTTFGKASSRHCIVCFTNNAIKDTEKFLRNFWYLVHYVQRLRRSKPISQQPLSCFSCQQSYCKNSHYQNKYCAKYFRMENY